MFREGLSLALGREPDFKVVGQFGSCVEALPVCARAGQRLFCLISIPAE